MRQVLQSMGYPPEKINKIFYCIDTSHFTDGVADAQLATDLAKLDYFLLVGRIVPQKDVLALVEVFAEINKQRPDTVLVIVGNRDQTPKYQRQIDQLVAARGVEKRVMFTGQVNNPAVLAALFANARLLFVTSEWESFCVPIAESLFFGVPTAVHLAPPMPEVAGPAGIVFDKANEIARMESLRGELQARVRQLKESSGDGPELAPILEQLKRLEEELKALRKQS